MPFAFAILEDARIVGVDRLPHPPLQFTDDHVEIEVIHRADVDMELVDQFRSQCGPVALQVV